MGVLKARVNGVWVPVTQGYTSATAGLVGYRAIPPTDQVVGTSLTLITNSQITGLSFLANHTYRLTWYGIVTKDATAGIARVSITGAAGTPIYAQRDFSLAANGWADFAVEYVFAGAGTTGETRQCSAVSTAGNMTVGGANGVYGGFFVIEDITTVQPTDGSMAGVWTAPSLTNGWLNWGAPYQFAQYRRVGDEVQLRGVIKSGTIGQSAFTLPVGFRPPANTQFAVETNNTHGCIDIKSAGDVVINSGSNTALNLNCSFSVTP